MCIDTANCSGTCSECVQDKVRRLTMANKQLTKMCDQYLAEKQQADTEMTRLRTLLERAAPAVGRAAVRAATTEGRSNYIAMLAEIDEVLGK